MGEQNRRMVEGGPVPANHQGERLERGLTDGGGLSGASREGRTLAGQQRARSSAIGRFAPGSPARAAGAVR